MRSEGLTVHGMYKTLSSFRGARAVICLFETIALDPKEEIKQTTAG